MKNKSICFGLASLITASTVLAQEDLGSLKDTPPIPQNSQTIQVDTLQLQLTPDQRIQLLEAIKNLNINIKDWSARESNMQPSRCCSSASSSE